MKPRQGLLVLAIVPAMVLAAASNDDYPPFNTTKTLYANHDYRARKAPIIEVQKWLRRPPSTKGKVVIVDFWATWCPPCRASIPELGEWQRKFRKDLVVIGISDEKPSVVAKFMKTTSMPYAVGVDQRARLKQKIGVTGIPHVLVISADGIVRWQGFPLDSDDPLTTQTVAQIIRASKAHAR